MDEFPRVKAWLKRFYERPAVKRSCNVPKEGELLCFSPSEGCACLAVYSYKVKSGLLGPSSSLPTSAPDTSPRRMR